MFRQGKKYVNYQKKYELEKKYKLLHIGNLSIADKLKSISYSNIEGFNPIEKKNLEEQNELINLESQFNETMQKYIRTYKKYLEQLISRQTSVNTKLKNTVVTYDGGFYYINNVGTAREFTSSSWNQRDQSKLDKITAILEEQLKLEKTKERKGF